MLKALKRINTKAKIQKLKKRVKRLERSLEREKMSASEGKPLLEKRVPTPQFKNSVNRDVFLL